MSEFYIPQLRQFEELVKELDANAEDNEVQRRANMIIALIEGLMVVASPPGKKEQITFRKNVLQQCLSIARGI
ncbi:MAG: hypothetical protein H7A03_07890 [Pseudomonadales bacterium]|nr:hypothetical protein [Pseudomonadales bacterium]